MGAGFIVFMLLASQEFEPTYAFIAITAGVLIALGVGWSIGGSANPRDEPMATSQDPSDLSTGIKPDEVVREQILHSMAEGIILLDSSGSSVYENPAATRLIGSTAMLPPDVLIGGVSEFSTRHPEPRALKVATSSIGDGYKLVVIHDVTDSRRTDDMRREFVSNVSHELKTPVSGILASAETLEVAASEDPPSVERFVGSLLTEARRLSKLVEDLLDLARLEQEAPPFESVGFSNLVALEIERVKDFAARKTLGIQAEVKPGVEVMGNSEDLTLAVRNLLVNAIRYTEDGRVTARLETLGGRAVFSVTDTGPGIPSKDLPRIFERFYRVDKARSRETGGTGLGLSIVRHVAERHGGEVRADSELGRGSTFTFSLPLKAV